MEIGTIWGYGEEKNRNGVDVWYQIESIFLKKSDEIPIGTRILAFWESSRSEDFKLEEVYSLPFHVFVPNIESE